MIMKKFNKALFLSATGIGLISSLLLAAFNPGKAIAQSECYLIDQNGQRIDLSKICDAPRPVRSRSSRVNEEELNLTRANLVENIPIQIINNNSPRRYITITRKNYTIIPDRSIVRSGFLDSVSYQYNNTENRILRVSDPYFSGTAPIIYRYQR